MDKKTPIDDLCTASWTGDLVKVQALLDKGINPGGRGFVFDPSAKLIVVDSDPYPFFNRISQDRDYHAKLDLVFELKPLGKPVTEQVREEQAYSPLHYACMNNHGQVVTLLLSSGAPHLNASRLSYESPDGTIAVSKQRWDSWEIAKRKGYADVASAWWDYEIGYPVRESNPYTGYRGVKASPLTNLLIIGGILSLCGAAYYYAKKSSP